MTDLTSQEKSKQNEKRINLAIAKFQQLDTTEKMNIVNKKIMQFFRIRTELEERRGKQLLAIKQAFKDNNHKLIEEQAELLKNIMHKEENVFKIAKSSFQEALSSIIGAYNSIQHEMKGEVAKDIKVAIKIINKFETFIIKIEQRLEKEEYFINNLDKKSFNKYVSLWEKEVLKTRNMAKNILKFKKVHETILETSETTSTLAKYFSIMGPTFLANGIFLENGYFVIIGVGWILGSLIWWSKSFTEYEKNKDYALDKILRHT